MARDLDSLVSLQQALAEADGARRQLDGVPESMREVHDQHQSRVAAIEELEQTIQEADLERRGAEAAARDAQTKLDRYQQQINRIKTQREYGSLLKEIDAVKAEISGFEEVALAALERAEEAQSLLDEQRSGFDELDGRYQQLLKEWEAEKPAVAARLQELETEVARLRQDIPRSLLLQFERLFDRHGGWALAAISQVQSSPRAPAVWHCSYCNYRVRPQVVVDIRNNGSLNQCERCQRFLYFEAEAH